MFFEGVLQLLRPNHAPKICPLRRPHVFPGDVGVMENIYTSFWSATETTLPKTNSSPLKNDGFQ